MINFLRKLFIKDYKNVSNPQVRTKHARNADEIHAVGDFEAPGQGRAGEDEDIDPALAQMVGDGHECKLVIFQCRL